MPLCLYICQWEWLSCLLDCGWQWPGILQTPSAVTLGAARRGQTSAGSDVAASTLRGMSP